MVRQSWDWNSLSRTITTTWNLSQYWFLQKRITFSFWKFVSRQKNQDGCLLSLGSFHAAVMHSNPSTMASAPYSPLRHPTSFNSSSLVTIISRDGAGFDANGSLSVSIVMFFCDHHTKIICPHRVWRQMSKKGQKGKQLCLFHSHVRSQFASVCFCFSLFILSATSCGHCPWAGHLGKWLTAQIKLKEQQNIVPNLILIW